MYLKTKITGVLTKKIEMECYHKSIPLMEENQKIGSHGEETNSMKNKKKPKRNSTKYIDRFAIVLFPLMFILFNIIYWVKYVF